MKNLILAFSAMFSLATAAVAQAPAATAPAPATTKIKDHAKGQGKDMGEKGKAQGEKGKGQMGGNLGLSPDQETKFKALNESQKAAVKTVQMDKSLSAEAKKAQVDALKSKYEADVKGVMNADQYTKWLALRAKRDDKKGEMEDHKGKMKGKGKSDKEVQPQGAAKSK
jgi:periplasmic protein CpxP/Spy